MENTNFPYTNTKVYINVILIPEKIKRSRRYFLSGAKKVSCFFPSYESRPYLHLGITFFG